MLESKLTITDLLEMSTVETAMEWGKKFILKKYPGIPDEMVVPFATNLMRGIHLGVELATLLDNTRGELRQHIIDNANRSIAEHMELQNDVDIQ